MSPPAPTVLVTGASGLLGRQVMSVLAAEGVSCTGLCFSRPSDGLTKLDITDFAATASLVKDLKPSHIIHAAAQRFPDKVEGDIEAAIKLNVESTRNLAEISKEIGSKMIYISTDYVFDGEHPPFFHDNKPNPLNKYGETRLVKTLTVSLGGACALRILKDLLGTLWLGRVSTPHSGPSFLTHTKQKFSIIVGLRPYD